MKQPLWLEGFTPMSTVPLTASTSCDICIIGGGLSGIYTAYLLAQQGFDVVLVEAQSTIAQGVTSYSTGKLTPQHNVIYSKLTESDGKTYYNANHMAIEAALLTNPAFTRATSYLYTLSEQGKTTLQQEAAAYKKIGIPMLATNETELALPVELALGMKDDAQVNPAHFCNHFAQLARQKGAQIFTSTRVQTVNVAQKHLITENSFTITYNKVIFCTHYPIESIKGLYSAKLQISRSYLMATKTSELLNGQYISIDSSSRTIRTALVNDIPYFIYGGTSHKAGTISETEKFYKTLQSELVVQFDLPEPNFMWSAQDMMTADSMPYIGQLTTRDPSLFVVTGFNKWGLSNSLVAGEIITATLMGKKHPAADLYSPSRSDFGRKLYFMLMTTGFIAEQFIAGYMTRLGAPRCTHLGCKTRWNAGDETWDCPCHGSRYDKNGLVIEGPAVYPLTLKKSDA